MFSELTRVKVERKLNGDGRKPTPIYMDSRMLEAYEMFAGSYIKQMRAVGIDKSGGMAHEWIRK
jgi:hypothetical protein